MADLDFKAALEQLGREFTRRGMHRHAAKLRVFYAHFLRRQRELQPREWSETIVIEWLRLLRIPPFDTVYAVVPSGTMSCPYCPPDGEIWDRFVKRVFEGGWLAECRRCARAWVVDERARPRGA